MVAREKPGGLLSLAPATHSARSAKRGKAERRSGRSRESVIDAGGGRKRKVKAKTGAEEG